MDKINLNKMPHIKISRECGNWNMKYIVSQHINNKKGKGSTQPKQSTRSPQVREDYYY